MSAWQEVTITLGPMNDPQIGSVIRALRVDRGWTQAELARGAGLSPATISRIEAGRLNGTSLGVLRHERWLRAPDHPASALSFVPVRRPVNAGRRRAVAA